MLAIQRRLAGFYRRIRQCFVIGVVRVLLVLCVGTSVFHVLGRCERERVVLCRTILHFVIRFVMSHDARVSHAQVHALVIAQDPIASVIRSLLLRQV